MAYLNNPLVLIPLSSGLIFILVGLFTLLFPPKKINGLYGYRTVNSMKNQKQWDFAQIYSSKEMIKMGVILACTSTIGILYQPKETIAMVLGIGLMILGVIYLFLKVEKKIKSEFSEKK